MMRALLLLVALGCVVAQPPPSENDLADILRVAAEPGVNGEKFNASGDNFYTGVRKFALQTLACCARR